VLADVGKSQRARIPDQLAEHAPALGKRPDSPAGLIVDPEVDEPLELLLRGVEDPQRRVLRLGQLARRLQDVPENGFDVKLGDQGATDSQEPAKLCLGFGLRGYTSIAPLRTSPPASS
jgi:hypothetical protein